MADEINIPIKATYDDSDAKEALADVKELDAADTEIVLKANVDLAKGELQAFQAELKATGERAEDTAKQLDRVGGDPGGGIKTRGNAIADLTGPLGEASSAASDFAGVFDGLGDIAEDVASKMGASSELAGKVSGALGGLGIAVAAGAAAWSFFQQRQQKAREETEKLRNAQIDLLKAIKDNNREAATTKFLEGFPKAIGLADDLGVSITEVTKFITGQISEQNLLTAAVRNHDAAVADRTVTNRADALAAQAADAAYTNNISTLEDLRKQYQDTESAQATTEQQTKELGDALGLAGVEGKEAGDEIDKGMSKAQRAADAASLTFQALRGELDMDAAAKALGEAVWNAMERSSEHTKTTEDDVTAVKDAIITLGETAALTPVEVNALVNAVTTENVNDVYRLAQELITRKGAVKIQAEIDAQMRLRSVTGVGPRTPDNERAAATSSTQIINFPRGMSVDAAMQLARSQSRNGRYYQGAGR